MTAYLEALTGCFLFLLVSAVMAAAVFPFFQKLFPLRVAWLIGRVAAPSLIAFTALSPALIFRRADFSQIALLISLGILCLGAVLIRRNLRDLPIPWKEIFRGELLFTAVFFGVAAFLPFISSLSGMGERMRDTAIWNAVLNQKAFPLEDPWLAGQTLYYYCFGYFSLAAIAVFTSLDPLHSYNISIAWTFAAYLVSLIAVFEILGFSRKRSVFFALGVGLSSNLKALIQAFGVFRGEAYNWWTPSRVIDDTINEFPLWTFSLGDLHPHFITLPYLVWILALLLAAPKNRVSLIGLALSVAWLWGGNSWEFPVALGLVVFVIALQKVPASFSLRERKGSGYLFVAAFVCLFSLVFLPQIAPRGRSFGWVTSRSSAIQFLQMWGLFLLPLAYAAFSKLRRDTTLFLTHLAFLVLGLAMNSALLIALVLFVVFLHQWKQEKNMLWVIGLFGLLVVLGCEIFHLRDVYGDKLSRMNTVFKFYVPAWTLLGIAAWGISESAFKPLVRALWAFALSAHLVFGLYARSGGYSDPASLTGLKLVDKDDAALALWMKSEREAKRLQGTLLEAPGGAYSMHGRFATVSGLPGYIAWEGYGFWPIGGVEKEAGKRFAMAREIFSSIKNCDSLHQKLTEAGIRYLAIGSLERKAYQPEAVRLIESCLTPLHRIGDSVVMTR